MTTMIHRAFSLALAVLGTCVCYAEQYRWNGSAETKEQLKETIEQASKEFNFMIRKIAVSRLKKVTSPYETIFFKVEGDTVIFERDGADRIEGKIGGPAVTWLKDYQVTFERLADGRIKQSFVAEDGTRENVYRIKEDGTLEIEVTIKTDKLKKPLTFTLIYVVDKLKNAK